MSDECLITLETVFSFCIDCQAVMRKFTLAKKINLAEKWTLTPLLRVTPSPNREDSEHDMIATFFMDD